MKTLIVIPARYNSTRLPGKPLMEIAGKPMLRRVLNKALVAARAAGGQCELCIATDDHRIIAAAHDWPEVKAQGVILSLTPADCPSGSDRAYLAYQQRRAQAADDYDLIVNLQGDAPFTPSSYIKELIACAAAYPSDQHESSPAIFTPLVTLDWQAYDDLAAKKQQLDVNKRSSGTTCVVDPKGRALWFSKNLLPLLRNETKLRAQSSLSPVLRHIGLYAYRPWALERFVLRGESHYESLEGLEQLRALEMNMWIQTLNVQPAVLAMTGVDTADDLYEAQRRLEKEGDDWQEI